jgi:adenosylhomocysteine nucleosidase
LLGIIAAFKEEVEDYLRKGRFKMVDRVDSISFYQSSSAPDVTVAAGGVGRERAETATGLLIDRYPPDFIVSAGFAGGVREGIGPGDLFLCDRLYSLEGPATFWGPDSAGERSIGDTAVIDHLIKTAGEDDVNYELCGCLSVPDLASGSSMKGWIGDNFPVDIIDMESYWVSSAAAAAGIRHVVARTVLDPLEQTLPGFVGAAFDDSGRRRWVRAAGYVLRKPREAPTMLRLAKQSSVANASLGGLLSKLAATVQ